MLRLLTAKSWMPSLHCRKEYARASSGTCNYTFRPQLDKSFSRGFTHYFLHGRSEEIFSFDTPKSLGEEMGTMKEQRGNYLTVSRIEIIQQR